MRVELAECLAGGFLNIGQSVERHVRISLGDFLSLRDRTQPAEGSKPSGQLGQCRSRPVHA